VPPGAFPERFRTALRLAYSEGAPNGTLAYSRAASLTWRSASGVNQADAEAARLRVYAEALEERREEPLRAGIAARVMDDGSGVDRAPEIPPARPLPDDRIRRGGRR
jgi:hypothetical protein